MFPKSLTTDLDSGDTILAEQLNKIDILNYSRISNQLSFRKHLM